MAIQTAASQSKRDHGQAGEGREDANDDPARRPKAAGSAAKLVKPGQINLRRPPTSARQ